MLKANGCSVDLYGNNRFTLASDISAVANATKLDFSGLGLEGPSCIFLSLDQCDTKKKPIEKRIVRRTAAARDAAAARAARVEP